MNSRNLKTLLAISATLLVFPGCARTISSQIDQNVVDSATAAATAIGGAVEDDSGDSVGNVDLPDNEDRAEIRVANSCAALSSQSCTAGRRGVTYSECALGGAAFRLSGTAELDYSNPNCKFSAIGDGISRKTHAVSLTLSSGTVFQSNSDDVSDYLGDQFGSAGSVLQLVRTGFSVAIQTRKTLQRAGDPDLSYDLTERTIPDEPLIIRGGLGRKTRKLKRGTLMIYHNLAKFTATHHFSNVVWGGAECCFPLGGSSQITFSGAVNGSATIQFGPDCGQYSITREDDTRTGVMTVCGR